MSDQEKKDAVPEEQTTDADKKAVDQTVGQEPSSSQIGPNAVEQDKGEAEQDDPKAKAAAAREARAKAREQAAKEDPAEETPKPPKPPSPNQPLLDKIMTLVKSNVNEEAVESGTINEKNDDLPTLYIKNENWHATAKLLRDHTDLHMNYLRNVSGVDMESHLETVYHFLSMTLRHECAVKVKIDRDQSTVDSVTDLWETANWNEREIYDLLGIQFNGHPNLVRIMMPDDWHGHPLRKDYEPLDEEV